MVFDLRCLPNPNWVPDLQPLTGLDERVRAHLAGEAPVANMFGDIAGHLESWLPRFEENSRSYITVAVGCTGGRHRSVYICEKLARHFERRIANVQVRHREIRT